MGEDPEKNEPKIDIVPYKLSGGRFRSMSRHSASQLWRKCPSCGRELFSEDHMCHECGQCTYCCQGVHMKHEPAKTAH